MNQNLSALACALLACTLGPSCLDWNTLETGACGDGFVGREESCDDGNRVPGDGCSDRCSLEPAMCGDGRKDPGEECDDANALDDDACLSNCQEARCGDGKLWDPEEECDDGNRKDGDGCSATCQIEPPPPSPKCGNGIPDGDEPCDDGNTNQDDACLTSCTWATCGDGVVRRGVEECDEGGVAGDCRGCLQCKNEAGVSYRGSNAHCYTLHSDALSQGEARAACQQEGGDLWTATSSEEATETIQKLLLQGPYWLGMTRNPAAESVTWVTGESTKYTDFAPGEPNASERCVLIDAQATASQWSSRACSSALPFVCERANAFLRQPDHHAYKLHTEALESGLAAKRCADDGGYLAVLETTEERAFVGSKVDVAAWVGAGDEVVEGVFVWSTGAPVDESEFAAGQPDDTDHTQNCIQLTAADRYNDRPCAEKRAFLCEFQ